MPFKSEAQRRACYSKRDPRWNCEEWERETMKRNGPQHVKAGRRAAELRSEIRSRFLFDVENIDPKLLPLAKKLEWKIPLKPRNQSRLEYFLKYVEENPDAWISAIDQTSKHAWPGREEEDEYDFLDPEDADYEDLPEDRHVFFEDRLSSKEARMLDRITSREHERLAESDGRETPRQLKAFYAKGKMLVPNGTMLKNFDRAKKIREDFMDRGMRKHSQVSWHWPKEFIEVGTVESVMYRSNKWQKDGSEIEYKHVAEAPQKLLIPKKYAKELGLKGKEVVAEDGEFPDTCAYLAELLAIQSHLNGDRPKDYAQLDFHGKCKLGAGSFQDGGNFLIVFDGREVKAVVVGEELDVLKDGIVG